jgi:ribosomal protein S16
MFSKLNFNKFPEFEYYRIRLYRCGRYKRPFFKIVVVNINNRIECQIGYFDPHTDGFKKKLVGLDRSACLYWLVYKKAIPSIFVFGLFEKIGLIKVK